MFRPQVIQLRSVINSGLVKGRMPSLEEAFVALFYKLWLQGISRLIEALVIVGLSYVLNFLDSRPGLIHFSFELLNLYPKLTSTVDISVKFGCQLLYLALRSFQPSLNALMIAFCSLDPSRGCLLQIVQSIILDQWLIKKMLSFQQPRTNLKIFLEQPEST